MACEVIDLDKYECVDDIITINRCDGDISDLEDYHTIDAEIIDYGIFEKEECEVVSPILKEQPLTSANNTFKDSGVNISKIPDIFMTKCVCIKVVDCNKYPWYYPKYKEQILKRKYQKVYKQAKDVFKCLKNDKSDEDLVINVDKLRDVIDSKIQQYVRKIHLSIDKPLDDYSKFIEHKEVSKKIEHVQTTNTQNVPIEKQSRSIDIKKNKGLIGMKVQKIDLTIKEYLKAKRKSYKTQEKGIKTKGKDKTDKKNGNESSDLVFYKPQVDEISKKSEPQRKKYDSMTQKSEKSKPKIRSLTCSLRITSPKRYMKIKKVKDKTDKKLSELYNSNLFSDTVTNQPSISNNDTINASLVPRKNKEEVHFNIDHKQHLNSSKKNFKCKPMPKSKKIALQKQISTNTFQEMPNKDNKPTKLILGTKSSATGLIKKKSELSMKSFPLTNNFTGKVRKIIQNNPLYDTDMKRCKIDKITRAIEEQESIVAQNILVTKTTTSSQPVLAKKGQNKNLENINNTAMCKQPNINKGKRVNNTGQVMRDSYSPIRVADIPIPTTSFSDQNKQLDMNLHLKSPLDNDGCTSESIDIPTLLSLSQEPPEPQEYIVPDLIHPPAASPGFSKEKTVNTGGIEKHSTGKHVPDSQQSLLNTVPLQMNTMQNVGSNIPCNKNSGIDFTINTATSTNHTINSQMPIPIRSHMLPNNIVRPNILRRSTYNFTPMPRCDSTWQQPSPHAQVMSPFYRPPPPPHGPRPWSPLKLVRLRHNHNYRQPNYVHQFQHINVQNVPWDNTTQHVGINYTHNNNLPQTVYSGKKVQTTTYYVPPGICNVQPNNNNLPQYLNPVSQPPLQPPAQCSTNIDNSTIIGVNASGAVKKINISTSAAPLVNNQNYTNTDGFKYNKNTSVNKLTPAYEKMQNIVVDSTEPVLTKSEMMKELEKAAMAEMEKLEQTNKPEMVSLKTNKSETKKSGTKPKLQQTFPETNYAVINRQVSKKTEDPRNVKPVIKELRKEAMTPRLQIHFSKNATLQELTALTNNADLKNSLPVKAKFNELKRPMSEIVDPDFGRTLVKDQNTKPVNYIRNNRPGPLSKKYKHNNDMLTTPPRNTAQMPSKGYSPPILPIPTYQNILSEVKHGISNKCHFTKSYTSNSEKICMKKCQQSANSVKDENAKKISLAEYKKRSLN